MNIAKDGLIIWNARTGEADKVLTILTDEGLVTAYARGCLRPNGRLTSATTMLSFSNFELASGKNMYTVVNAESQQKFLSIYGDAVSYALATYFCEVIRLLMPSGEETRDYLNILMNMLHLLNTKAKPQWQIKAVFELTMMTLSGYMPNVNACVSCGSEQSSFVFFDYNTGSWYCSDCSARKGLSAEIPFSVIRAVQYVITSEPRRAMAFDLKSPAREAFSYLAERFLLTHIEHDVQTLNYYNALIST